MPRRIEPHTPPPSFDEPDELPTEALDAMDEAAREAMDGAIRREARAQALEIVTRFLIWIAEGNALPQRGLRATVALYCVRPDLIGGCSLSQIGELGGCMEQNVHKLAKQFRANMNLKPKKF